MTHLLDMQSRLHDALHNYELTERMWRRRWITLEGVVLIIGLLTPLIVAFRKSGLYPVEFWVWWCIITPLIAAGCVIMMRVTAVQDKCLTNRRRVRRLTHMIRQAEMEIQLAPDDAKAIALLRDWNAELSKIELDY